MSPLALLLLLPLAAARMAYQLPADAELLLSEPLQQTFSCEQLPYGYYADVANNCQIFHVCQPLADDIGALLETAHFTFACGEGTIFDQQTLTCQRPSLALPCGEASAFFRSANEGFGRVERPSGGDQDYYDY